MMYLFDDKLPSGLASGLRVRERLNGKSRDATALPTHQSLGVDMPKSAG